MKKQPEDIRLFMRRDMRWASAHAFRIPWTKENIGHHIVRNNTISHCEQTGIVGSMGCSFSTITGNATQGTWTTTGAGCGALIPADSICACQASTRRTLCSGRKRLSIR